MIMFEYVRKKLGGKSQLEYDNKLHKLTSILYILCFSILFFS